MLKQSKKTEKWQQLLIKQPEKLVKVFNKALSVEVAEFLEEQPLTVCIGLLNKMRLGLQGEIFGLFNEKKQMAIYAILGPQLIAPIFVKMASDARVDFYQELDEKRQAELLPFLPRVVKKEIITLSSYSADVAGGIMNTDFMTLKSHMTAEEALIAIRSYGPSQKMIYHLYVVDEQMKLLGVISVKKIILAAPETIIEGLVTKDFVYVNVQDDREIVAATIEKYGFVAVPVLNSKKQLVGIVSQEDALEVIRAEQTEDMERFMGIVSNEEQEDYLQESALHHFKKRIGWLAGLFVASFLSGYATQRYGAIINIFPVLSFLLPSLNDAGGNAGSQVAVVIIRALALGQITVRHWVAILWKEIRIALLCACILFGLMVLRIVLLTDTVNYALPPSGIWWLSFIVALALSLQILSSTIIGAMLPLFIKKLQFDPALAASPAITTLVDLTGMLIYFTVLHLFLT